MNHSLHELVSEWYREYIVPASVEVDQVSVLNSDAFPVQNLITPEHPETWDYVNFVTTRSPGMPPVQSQFTSQPLNVILGFHLSS